MRGVVSVWISFRGKIMGRKNKSYSRDLHQQAYDIFNAMLSFGESKKQAVTEETDKEKIFSFNTYKTYWKHTKYFLGWIRQEHPECTTLRAAKKYVNDWLELRASQTDENGNHLSAWTIQTEAAALNKLYGIDKADIDRFQPPKRNRCDIRRSRVAVERDRHFSVTNNDELIRFCRGTGVRRNVLEKLEGRDLWPRDRMEEEAERLKELEELSEKEKALLITLTDALSVFPEHEYFIHHRQDKGGRYRFAPIIGEDRQIIIDRMKRTPPDEKVWLYVSSNADIHAYRADYATAMYRMYARNIEDIPFDRINRGTGKPYQSDVYICRIDEKGKKLDKAAMKKCSKALGHNRISVIADHYIRGL